MVREALSEEEFELRPDVEKEPCEEWIGKHSGHREQYFVGTSFYAQDSKKVSIAGAQCIEMNLETKMDTG